MSSQVLTFSFQNRTSGGVSHASHYFSSSLPGVPRVGDIVVVLDSMDTRLQSKVKRVVWNYGNCVVYIHLESFEISQKDQFQLANEGWTFVKGKSL